MSSILGPNGQPFQTFRRAPSPRLGPAYGRQDERDEAFLTLPGGATLTFDLSNLSLADYRSMRYHPQVNASLSSLTFMMHQIDWHIECKDQKIADKVERNFRDIWTKLIRGMSQAFWAGYSPNAIEYENSNDKDELDIVVKRVKDLVPETCDVHWKVKEGAPAKPGGIPPKFKYYDGINQHGVPPIPVENSLWYPLLMENGNYKGRQLLKAVFTPWYFSTIIHLFANRYYERFGEPTPIGRAPYQETLITRDGTEINGKEIMDNILSTLRNRGAVNLPSDRDPVTKEFDYTLEFLESQMRGVDFERYLTRLDEEISLGLFTPLLLMKTGEVGSNNLGVQHTQTWLWILNAIAGDMAEYLTVLAERLKAINFTPNAPTCRWVPRKLGKDNNQTTRSILTEMIRKDKAQVDLVELGKIAGLTVEEVSELSAAPVGTPAAESGVREDVRDRTERTRGQDDPQTTTDPRDGSDGALNG